MAALPATDRAEIAQEFSSNVSGRRDPLDLSQPDLQSAVDAIDAWIDANAGPFNQAIPQPARTALTTRHKNELFSMLVARRYNLTP